MDSLKISLAGVKETSGAIRVCNEQIYSTLIEAKKQMNDLAMVWQSDGSEAIRQRFNQFAMQFETQKLENELTQFRIVVMLSQIQPHFLYNALSSIQCLCRDDPAAAEKATADFSMFLRGNMDSLTMDKPIGFAKELEHNRHYLSLEKLRFPDKLHEVYDIRTT